MTSAFTSYVLCGTPRSGSTLLCKMLAAAGVAGRPNSYFRQEDVQYWANEWGVPYADGIDNSDFDCRYLAAMTREASAGTGILGLRIMWESVAEATRRLNRALSSRLDFAQGLDAAFGPTLYVHLSRHDKIAQAVSLLRAKQSGLWHLAADGTVLEGAETVREIVYDRTRIAENVEELRRDDEAWNTFFDERQIVPLKLVYETVTTDPNAALGAVLATLELDPAPAKSVRVPTGKIGDAESDRWIERFRRESDA